MYQAVNRVPGIKIPNNIFPLLKDLGPEEQHAGKSLVGRCLPHGVDTVLAEGKS